MSCSFTIGPTIDNYVTLIELARKYGFELAKDNEYLQNPLRIEATFTNAQQDRLLSIMEYLDIKREDTYFVSLNSYPYDTKEHHHTSKTIRFSEMDYAIRQMVGQI